MSHVVGDFSHCIFNTKQMVDRFEYSNHYYGAAENDRNSTYRKNHHNPSTGLQRIYSAYQCFYSLVSKSKEKTRCLTISASIRIAQGVFIELKQVCRSDQRRKQRFPSTHGFGQQHLNIPDIPFCKAPLTIAKIIFPHSNKSL